MIKDMKAMGLTDIFDDTVADFTPMVDAPMLFASQINHAARVAIDEACCIAAPFTVIDFYGGACRCVKETDFVLDRPFLFVISIRDNLSPFAGVVNEP